MAQILTRADARQLRNLDFCYLCGATLGPGEHIDHDHVPPSAVFDTMDRDFPLKLPVHRETCHTSLNLEDEMIGQLVSLLHGKHPNERDDRLRLDVYQRSDTGGTLASFSGANLELLLRRWIKGFHAALYRAPLPDGTKYAIQTPFPSGQLTEEGLVEDELPEQHYAFVDCIKRNRAAGNLDMIECNNGKLRYECVWDTLSDESRCCVFALRLYDWADLGDVNNFPSRGCAGLYSPPPTGVPADARTVTKLEFTLDSKHKADSFLE